MVTRIKNVGSEQMKKQLNKTLQKWKNEKVRIGIAGGQSTGKSSFANVLSYGSSTLTVPTNVSFIDFPGCDSPVFGSRFYFRQTSIDPCDYVLIFFHVVSKTDTWFAKTLNEKKMKFCFVRTKLDIDVDSTKHDNLEDTDPDLMAKTLRQTAVEAIEKEGLENPTVFVISNRRKDIGHFSILLSHIEQVLQREKYQVSFMKYRHIQRTQS